MTRHPLPEPVIRAVTEADEAEIALLLASAFGQDAEAHLVNELRACGSLILERVSVDPDGTLEGYVAFSRVTGAGAAHRLAISCLAPVAVRPDRQRSGVGTQLIEAALADLRADGEDLVLVLGPPSYYPRFGFDAALAAKVSAPYAGTAFQALALSEAAPAAMPIEVDFATPFQAFD
ncbi:GNAT family N-acetyltransferase [Stappia sp. ES.058]|uniref:GNAT family N-acetyltransferase n=1 Tax=Stappia sp. ES.058 TaxID=1881061 RepID=UPI00087C5674|nr:N-acetyltransferase [Stappia sp. ES.058]SDT89099.1 putative acetyltransferase [Stappia sp. ES.058]